MSVVLRCPNCGTTKNSAGECEACGEGAVRYFCTNHTPGVWLDGPECPKCGAIYGAAERRVPAAPPTRPRAPARTGAPARASSAAATVPPPHVRRDSSRAPLLVTRERLPADEEELEADSSAIAPWQRLLGAVIRARSTAREAAGVRGTPTIARGAGGCLRRLVLVAVFAIAALVVALVLLGRAVFQGFSVR